MIKNTQQQYYSFHVSDLTKSLWERVYEFCIVTHIIYWLKLSASDSAFDQLRLVLSLFHHCVENLEPVLLGTTPFSLGKINRNDFLCNFTKKEQIIVKKAFIMLYEAEQLNKGEKEELFKSQMFISQILTLGWQFFRDCTSIVKFLTDNSLGLLFLALKMCCSITYKKLYENG